MERTSHKSYSAFLAIKMVFGWLAAAFLGFLTIFPFIYILSTALKSSGDLASSVNRVLPQQVQWGNFADAWKLLDFPPLFFNSMVVCVAITLGTILVCSMAAYVFTRIDFRFRNVLFLLYLSTMMIPITIRLIPSYMLCKQLNLLNTYSGMILPQIAWNIPFGTFLMRQFFFGIPKALDEAAEIDGSGHIRIFLQIILPNAKSAMTTLGIYVFVQAWNNLIWVLLAVNKPEFWTITLGIGSICGASVVKQPSWNLIMGVIVIGMLPVLILYLIFQKYFMQSVASSGIK